MKSQKFMAVAATTLACMGFFYGYVKHTHAQTAIIANNAVEPTSQISQNPLSIIYMQQQSYPGSDLKIEQTLAPAANYTQYIASYLSDNLKIYGLLTIPKGTKPASGWPVIIFNHGYIRPDIYQTTVKYELYVQAMASDGYIVFKPDYRGNGNSQGSPDSTYFSPDYTIDTLNALASLKKYPDANPSKIGMWGHSDGGDVVLRSMVVDGKDIKAAVVWGGVIAPYQELTANWQALVPYHQSKTDLAIEDNHMQELLTDHGTPAQNPVFWNSIDPNNFLSIMTTPLQLDVGGSDEEVPTFFSANLDTTMTALGKSVIYYSYLGENHNISFPLLAPTGHFTTPYTPAMQNTLDFFDKYLK